jgi:hypothetical protein
VREQFMPWLAEHHPDLVDRYRAMYPRAYAPADERRRMSRRVGALVAAGRRRWPEPETARRTADRFRRSPAARAPGEAQQPTLF